MRILEDHAAVLAVSDPLFGKLGYLVIDTAYMGRSVGGVRIMPDVTLAEISHMARTMTNKYLFTGLPFGGAKAGIILSGRAAADRRGAIEAFGRALWPFMHSGFSPGCDMGSSIRDIEWMIGAAGFRMDKRWIPASDRYTAWTVIAAIEAAMEMKGMGWEGRRVAIDGMGKVGSHVASIVERKGGAVTAVSNTLGSVCDPEGLEAGKLAAMRAEKGSAFIRECGKPLLPKEAVFGAECDVFVPCARCWSVNQSNSGKIRASIIVPAANAAMEEDVERALCAGGKLVVPDGIGNCGGVLGTTLVFSMDDTGISRVIEKQFKPRVRHFLASAFPRRAFGEFCAGRKVAISEALSPRPSKSTAEALLENTRQAIERALGKKKAPLVLFPER
ncbi:MAG: Glu/Leu/Phe/Val dehydrogenase dimerization domain-containing protein [Candidatus Micrarchaeota archaeon]